MHKRKKELGDVNSRTIEGLDSSAKVPRVADQKDVQTTPTYLRQMIQHELFEPRPRKKKESKSAEVKSPSSALGIPDVSRLLLKFGYSKLPTEFKTVEEVKGATLKISP